MNPLESLEHLERNRALAPYTTYKIGGAADYFVAVTNQAALVKAVRVAREVAMPYFILGSGANILVSDKGFRGLVIHNQACHFSFADERLTAESGATIVDLIKASSNEGLSGLEHYAGIPSTVGGAIWQNLHFLAPDRTHTVFIAEIIEHVTLLDEVGEIRQVPPAFFQFGYDQSILHSRPEIVVISVTFHLQRATQELIEHQVSENLAWRTAKHPSLAEFPSSGSVFKQIEGVGAGRLIDQAGLKGYILGGVQVSPQHANFLVNLGTATAADVRALITYIQEEVKQKTGYSLETEITFVGDWRAEVSG